MMNNMGTADSIIRAKKLSFEAIHILRQRIVTQLQSSIDQIPRLQNDAFAKAIFNIAFLARRHTILSFMETNKMLDDFPVDFLIASTTLLVRQCLPHASPDFTPNIKLFLENSPYALLIKEEHMRAFRKTFKNPNVSLKTKEFQIKLATIMKLPTEELHPLLVAAQLAQKPVQHVPHPSGGHAGNRASPLAKYTLLQAHMKGNEDIISVDDKYTDRESDALEKIKKNWHQDTEKKRQNKI